MGYTPSEIKTSRTYVSHV